MKGKKLEILILLIFLLFFFTGIVKAIPSSGDACDDCPVITPECNITCNEAFTGRDTVVGDEDYFNFTIDSYKKVTIQVTPATFTDYDLIVVWDENVCDGYKCTSSDPGYGIIETCTNESLPPGTYYINVSHTKHQFGSTTYDMSVTCEKVTDGYPCAIDYDCQSDNCAEKWDLSSYACCASGECWDGSTCRVSGYNTGTYLCNQSTWIECSQATVCDEWEGKYCDSSTWAWQVGDSYGQECGITCKRCSGTTDLSEGDLGCTANAVDGQYSGECSETTDCLYNGQSEHVCACVSGRCWDSCKDEDEICQAWETPACADCAVPTYNFETWSEGPMMFTIGRQVLVNIYVRNTGNVKDTYNISVEKKAEKNGNSVVHLVHVALSSDKIRLVEPGETKSNFAMITLLGPITKGNITFNVTSESAPTPIYRETFIELKTGLVGIPTSLPEFEWIGVAQILIITSLLLMKKRNSKKTKYS